MDEKPFGVHVVVDSRFGNRLREIPTGEPVWIVDTPINRLAYEAVAKERAPESYFDGLTSFKVDPGGIPRRLAAFRIGND